VSLGLLLLFGHIASMFGAVVVAYGPALVFQVARRSADVATLRALSRRSVLAPLVPLLFVVGGLFGLATAGSFGFDLLAPWLVIAYVLWVLAMALGVTVHAPYYRRVHATLMATPDGRLPAAAAAVVDDGRERMATGADYVIILALLFDMVVKPFS
jgi:hypothetical protein